MSSSTPPGLTSLATVSKNGRSIASVRSGNSALVMLADPTSAAAEAYRALAANLHLFSGCDLSGYHVIPSVVRPLAQTIAAKQ